VLDDLPAKTEKTKTSAGGLSPPMSKYKPEDRSLSKPAPQGDTSGQASQNLLLNLYSLVKERRNGKPSRNEHDRFEAGHAQFE
jgi:hypothetical protein